MKAYLDSHSPSRRDNQQKSTPENVQAKVLPKINITPIILKHESDHQSRQSHESQKQRGSMEHLCLLFLNLIASREPGKFEAKELLDDSGIKQRRIYDLMNILEGCGFLRRISKGAYYWNGFNAFPTPNFWSRSSKDSTSLSTLAAHVRSYLFLAEGLIEFKDIVRQISEQHEGEQINPVSIKRRVYECCKVLKVLGLVKKEGHSFRWAKERPELSSLKQRGLSSTKMKRKSESSKKNLPGQPKEQISVLIDEVLDKIHGEEELNVFIRHLRGAFCRRLEQEVVRKQLKFE